MRLRLAKFIIPFDLKILLVLSWTDTVIMKYKEEQMVWNEGQNRDFPISNPGKK